MLRWYVVDNGAEKLLSERLHDGVERRSGSVAMSSLVSDGQDSARGLMGQIAPCKRGFGVYRCRSRMYDGLSFVSGTKIYKFMTTQSLTGTPFRALQGAFTGCHVMDPPSSTSRESKSDMSRTHDDAVLLAIIYDLPFARASGWLRSVSLDIPPDAALDVAGGLRVEENKFVSVGEY